MGNCILVEGPMVFGVRDRKAPVIAVDVLPALIQPLPSVGKSHHGGGSGSRSPPMWVSS